MRTGKADRRPICRMAVWWTIAVALGSFALAVFGPALERRLPKLRSTQRERGVGSRVYSTDFERVFRTHAISLPKGTGEVRVAYTGNSQLARASFADAAHAAFQAADPAFQVYGLAWPGLNASGQVTFVRRLVQEQPDVLIWAISPADCLEGAPLFAQEGSPLAVNLGTGVGDALANFRYVSRENSLVLAYNLLGELFPHVRYGNVLSELAPALPRVQWERRDRARGTRRETRPRAPFMTAATHPPEVALAALDATRPLVPRSVRLVLLVMPHHAPDAWFGPGQLQRFTGALRAWAAAHDATVVDLSRLLPDEAFWDAFHFGSQWDSAVADALARGVLGSAVR